AGDLSALSGMRSAAAELLRVVPHIDVLVHNAGVWPTRLERTGDGFEQAFAVNHLAPFLLNHLLEERLRADRTRVIQVSAGLYVKGRVDPERTPTGGDFHRMRTYCTTKLANLLTVPLFAERWEGEGPTVLAVHPGIVRTSLGDPGGITGLLLKAVKRTWAEPEAAVAPLVRPALAPGAANGGYYDGDRPTPLQPPATDALLARRVWDQALALTGLEDDSDRLGSPGAPTPA
ncbi:SDR family oxidoreductase, partial [Streptomyces sp. NPDC058572]|uniref:SDR family oxidoreductase n=1 Tax=Streptomyces sp. NPDC058572 TaxID=3346546 RepID=UPI0036658E44